VARIRENLDRLQTRSQALLVASLVLLTLLGGSLIQFQILERDRWTRLAVNNRLRKLPVPSTRGRIFDRSGAVLADNVPSWRLLLFPDEVDTLDRTLLFLHRLGVGSVPDLRERERSRRLGTMAPLALAEDLTWDQVAQIRSRQIDFPELAVVEGFRRIYPHDATLAHVLGHLRYASQDDLDAHPEWSPDRLVGAIGIEALAEDRVAARDGERWVVASAAGKQLGVVKEVPGSPGADLGITIDLRLQRAAAAALGDQAGAVVVMDPETGAVRALYSSPSFDPNIFSAPLSRASWEALSSDPGRPLQNRSLQGTYPPGSTIKPVLVLAGLAEGVIDPGWSVYCTGGSTLYNTRFRCWNRGGHGRVGLERSLTVSCDVYYYQLGQKLGIDTMAAWFSRFGLGRRTGTGLLNESPGLVGTPEWKMRVRGQRWYAGESVSVSIGQGPVNTTVLQMARVYAALANGGRLVRPHLIPEVGVPDAEELGLDPEALERVVRGLTQVARPPEGTARSLAGLPVAGKTGTAQVVRLSDDEDDELSERFRHHAWFVGWGPLDEPRFVVAVLVEHGGGGGSVAAPVARKVFQAALNSVSSPESDTPDGTSD
jgi:penicillin-binding protein 2